MNVLHLSARTNRESILKNGLLPSKVKSWRHLDRFHEDDIVTEDSDRAIYTWEDCERNQKFERDMVYCIVWLHGRNALLNYKEPIDFSTLTEPIYEYDQMIFDLYTSIVPDKKSNYLHDQTHGPDNSWSSFRMDERFEHNDKKLHIFTRPLRVKPIGELLYTYRNGRIEIG